MISKYFKLALSPQSLQEHRYENKFLAQWKCERVKVFSTRLGAVELCRSSLSHSQEQILPWMLEIKSQSPYMFNSSKSIAVDMEPDTSKAASSIRLLNQLCIADLFFHFVSACTPLAHEDCWELILISVNPGMYYSCLVSKTGKLFCSILYFHILTGNT